MSSRRKSLFALATLAVAGAMVVSAPVATAQQVAGSDQYQGGVGPAGGADQSGPDGGAGPAAGGPSTVAGAESGGGSLPFTGYPMTPLVLLVIALVAAGLAFRLGSKARDRFRAAGPVSS